MSQESIADTMNMDEQGEMAQLGSELARDVAEGLSLPLKELSPKYFYDERGSELFEEICTLPEYYQTRTERSILERIVPDLVASYHPATLVEFGSGSSAKTRVLLDGMAAAGTLRSYVPIDVSREMLLATARTLSAEYPDAVIAPVVGDFNDGLPALDAEGPVLAIFLGSTIGNFRRPEAVSFLRNVAGGMGPDDLFLLGLDRVKDPEALNAAYNDAAGVTAEFNLNVLHVINRELGARFDLATFTHYAFYNPGESQIEMHLVSTIDQRVPLGDLGTEASFERGETIRTEISRKFTRRSAERLLGDGGMELVEWYTDSNDLFALALARVSR